MSKIVVSVVPENFKDKYSAGVVFTRLNPVYKNEGEEDEQFALRMVGLTVFKDWDHHVIDEGIIPKDPLYRNALTWANGVVDYDMEKAREIHRQSLRLKRKPVLEQLDAEYMKALEAKDDARQEAITTYKQMLRDVTDDARFDSAESVEDLKKINLPQKQL